MKNQLTIRERFQGCLLGLAIGDSLGARFEGQSAEHIQARYPAVRDLIDNPSNNELWYTDDAQMAIGVAETLVDHRGIVEGQLCAAFVSNYAPSRGYGRGSRKVLEAMEDGKDHRQVAATVFPGGSLGNGAAMRVAPVGLFFRDDHNLLWEQSKASALPTHVHPLGIEGAQLLALAVALASQAYTLDRNMFFAELISRCASDEFRQKLTAASEMTSFDEVPALGNGIEALESVPTAIACFAIAPTSYETAVANAVFLGGDTDTIAAMTGALSGAFLSIRAIPDSLVRILEDLGKGRTYIIDLADRLCSVYEGTIGTEK